MTDIVEISEEITHKRVVKIQISAGDLERMVIDRARKLAGLPPLDQVGKSIWHCVKFKYGYHNIDNDCDPMMAVVEITEDLAAMERDRPKRASEL
jgi:hypothetical protein